MLQRLFFVLVILFISSGLFAEYPHKYYGLRCDRMLHFGFGYNAATAIGLWTNKINYIKEDYGIISISFPVVIGYLKEVYDWKSFNPKEWKKRNPRDPNDAYWDFASVVFGAVLGKFMTYTF